MPYIGNQLATQFQAFTTQTITGDGSTGYTLDRAVANGKELLVYINNVKQEEGSGKAYTASGTTITFSEAVASGDSCYVVFLGSAIQTVTAPSGSIVSGQFANAELVIPNKVGLNSLSPADYAASTLSNHLVLGDASADTGLTVVSGASNEGAITFADGTSGDALDRGRIRYHHGVNKMLFHVNSEADAGLSIDINNIVQMTKQPAFLAHGSSGNDDMTAGSVATVVFGTEVYDQNSDFASNTFTAPVDGKYLLIGTFLFTDVDTDCTEVEIRINTSNRIYRLFQVPSKQLSADGSIGDSLSVVADMDASDTAIIQVTPANGANQMNIHPYTFFSGCLLS
jgi:hypothetical protein